MAKIMDGQVRHLFRLLEARESLLAAALKTGMDRKTARRYRNMAKLPSEQDRLRNWRTRLDPFDGVWQEVSAYLEAEPTLQAKTLFGWLQARYPGQFEDGQLRTLQRRVRHWRATAGPARPLREEPHRPHHRLDDGRTERTGQLLQMEPEAVAAKKIRELAVYEKERIIPVRRR